jgi:hypothetical protein
MPRKLPNPTREGSRAESARDRAIPAAGVLGDEPIESGGRIGDRPALNGIAPR